MTWISTIPYAQATGTLRKLYDRVKGPDDNVDNIMLAHSLRPHTMEGHMALYKQVLHHTRNRLDKAYLETVGVYVSLLNNCSYCIEHHFAGLKRLLRDDARADAVCRALRDRQPAAAFDGRELAGLCYVERLTTEPASLSSGDIDVLREAGFADGEILEINQVSAYFAYANRVVLGLGVASQGDIIGLSPGDAADADNWRHE